MATVGFLVWFSISIMIYFFSPQLCCLYQKGIWALYLIVHYLLQSLLKMWWGWKMLSLQETVFSDRNDFLGTKHWYKGILKKLNLQGHILNKEARITVGTVVDCNLVFKWSKMIIEVSDTDKHESILNIQCHKALSLLQNAGWAGKAAARAGRLLFTGASWHCASSSSLGSD